MLTFSTFSTYFTLFFISLLSILIYNLYNLYNIIRKYDKNGDDDITSLSYLLNFKNKIINDCKQLKSISKNDMKIILFKLDKLETQIDNLLIKMDKDYIKNLNSIRQIPISK